VTRSELLSTVASSADMPPTAGEPDPAVLPRYSDRRAGAEIVSRYFFPTSYRTLEEAPLLWRRVNGRAICETVELLAWAQAKLDAAPPIRGGRRRADAAPATV
jgi:hypothetical protein